MKYDVWTSAYQSKAIELANSTISLLCQSAHPGYAGNPRRELLGRLHAWCWRPQEKLATLLNKMIICGIEHINVKLLSLEVLLYQSAHQGCARMVRQLHLVKAKEWNCMRDKLGFFSRCCHQLFTFLEHYIGKDRPSRGFRWSNSNTSQTFDM